MVQKLAYASPEFSFPSCEDLAYKTSCNEPESCLQRKRQFIVTTSNSMQWSIQAALIPRRPFWLRVSGVGQWANNYPLPRGGVPNIPKESPISAPCTCHVLEDSHVNKVIAGLIYWSHFSLKLDLGCKIWRHFIAFRCRPLWFHPYFPHAKKRSPPSLLQILLKQLPCRHRIWSL